MKKQCVVSFLLAGVSLTDFGLQVPSPFTRLDISQAEVDSYTSWTLTVTVGGSANRGMNSAAFEALLYSSAQSASGYNNSSGIPVSFLVGWLDDTGNVSDHMSYQGWTLQFQNSAQGQFMVYTLTGYAELGVEMSVPVLNVPALCGFVQPSAVVEGLAKAIHADDYYDLDIDHCDAPTLVSHEAMTTSFTDYVRGSYTGEDDYKSFPGLLKLSTSYNFSRDAAGLKGLKKLSQGINNLTVTPLSEYVQPSITDYTPQASTFSFWVEEPTMTKLGVIHYKSNAGIVGSHHIDTLEYGTSNTNVLSVQGSYNGVSYNISDLNLSYVGFSVDGSGNSIANTGPRLRLAFCLFFLLFCFFFFFFGLLAQPVSLIIMLGNTVSPMSGVYNIMQVSHSVAETFVTTLKLQRLVMSSANQVATQQGLIVSNETNYFSSSTYNKTNNILSTNKVDFGEVYPTFRDLTRL